MALTPQRVSPPLKGLNTTTPVREMTQEFATRLDNVWFNQAQAMGLRPCQHIVNDDVPVAGVTIKQMFEYIPKVKTTASELFAWCTDGKIYPWATTWGAAVQSGGVDLVFTTRPRTSILGNLLLVSNGVDTPYTYNGVSWAAVTQPPATDPLMGNILYTHAARMYCAGSGVDRMILFYSDVSTGSGANEWRVSTGKAGFLDLSGAVKDGDEITGLTSYQGMLVVFLKNHTVFYKGTDPDASAADGFVVHKVIRGIGCLTQDSIQGIGNDTIFLSQYGFKSLQQVLVQGDAAAHETSVPINNFVLDEINAGRTVVDNIRSVFVERWGVYLCSFGQTALAYHTTYGAWSTWDSIQEQLFQRLDGTVYTAGQYMHEMSENNAGDRFYDYGAAAVGTEQEVAMVWETPPFRAGGNEVKARWNRLELIYEAEEDTPVDVATWINVDKSLIIHERGITLNPLKAVTRAIGMQWFGGSNTKWSTTAANPNTVYPTALNQWGGTALLKAGTAKVPLRGRAELMSARITNKSLNRFKITALEMYSNAGGIR